MAAIATPPPPLTGNNREIRRDLALLALVFGLIYFFQLGAATLVNPDESRYAEIPREMVATGEFVLPRLNGVVYFEKPPLLYWSVAGFLQVFGPHELAMRATPALFALFGVLITYAAGRRLHGRLAGLAAAVVLGTSLLYFALSRVLILDMAVSVLITATLFCFILGVREPPGSRRRWLFYGLYASAALATLTRTRGSTFRRPGARMLVCGDGTVVRGLSGGCPEADRPIIFAVSRVIFPDGVKFTLTFKPYFLLKAETIACAPSGPNVEGP